jgi:hypothetical protein
MRTLYKNEKNLYVLIKTGETYAVDDDGNFTGELIPTYTSPVLVRLSVYPSSGNVVYDLNGVSEQFDYIAISNTVVLKSGDLLFNSVPTDVESYDYKVSSILESLNVWRYGLKARV